jgi:glycosyltransferase involved in cell wall biosynthesis
MFTFSIITICFNNLSDLQKTCASVDNQILHPFEHIIVDGSTNSDIANWLNKNKQPNYRKWVCELDNGIADAFNKGIEIATGNIIQILNSADIYTNNTVLKTVSDAFSNNSTIDWISGKIVMQRMGINVLIGKPFDANKVYRGMRSVSHPTWFVKKLVYKEIGKYNEQYTIAMDYDMMCRLVKFNYLFLDIPMVIFDPSGVSNKSYLNSLQQNKLIYESYFGYSILLEIWQIRLKTLYILQKTILGKMLFFVKRKLGLENL